MTATPAAVNRPNPAIKANSDNSTLPSPAPMPKASRGLSVHLAIIGTRVTAPERLNPISTAANQTAHQSSFFHSELTPLLMIHSCSRPVCDPSKFCFRVYSPLKSPGNEIRSPGREFFHRRNRQLYIGLTKLRQFSGPLVSYSD